MQDRHSMHTTGNGGYYYYHYNYYFTNLSTVNSVQLKNYFLLSLLSCYLISLLFQRSFEKNSQLPSANEANV